ncbi:MAG: hypothetical protein P8188_10045 [Gemmatimonadota bacterium]
MGPGWRERCDPGRPAWFTPVLSFLLVAGLSPFPARAQLISPGRLASAHQELEGIRNCTACHRLRQKGVDRDRCLACHTPLAARVSSGRGFHGTLPENDCAACHKDHFGPDFDLLHFDPVAFDHERAGYSLTGGHRDAGCRDCHVPAYLDDPDVRAFKARYGALDRTFLGLGTTCLRCHRGADPHQGQFAGEACDACHDTNGWAEAPGFDHGETRYPLTGAHRRVDCTGCHPPLPAPATGAVTDAGSIALRFAPIAFSGCASCHQDPHGGTMQGACATCHGTATWGAVDRGRLESTFDHRSTGFELEDSHAALACATCHDPAAADTLEGITLRFQPRASRPAYPPPRAETCASCHDDAHRGEFRNPRDAGGCDACHGQSTWLPARFDLARHDAAASFPLEGAHRVTPCAGCHRSAEGLLQIRLGNPDCATCHGSDDPHRDQFPDRGCSECHGVESFRIPDFDHDRTGYRLEGAHVAVECGGCHTPEPAPSGTLFIRYRPLGGECVDCHGGAS